MSDQISAEERLNEYIAGLEHDVKIGLMTQQELDQIKARLGISTGDTQVGMSLEEIMQGDLEDDDDPFDMPYIEEDTTHSSAGTPLDMGYYPGSTLTDRQKDSLMKLQDLIYRECLFRLPEKELLVNDEKILYAKNGDRMIAALWFSEQYQDNHICIEKLYVHQDFRGSGWGRALIEKLMNDITLAIDEERCSAVIAHSVEEAIPFYEAMGFQPSGKPDPYSVTMGNGENKLIKDQKMVYAFTKEACDEHEIDSTHLMF